MDHTYWMQKAIAVAEKARIDAPPNPWVGCVIVKDNCLIAEGFTQPPGQLHAEVMALGHAGENAKGSIVYVTLEPCCHWGRTPPCTDALIQAGVAEVIFACEDPDLKVAGKGAAALKDAGIKVTPGICRSEVETQLKPYFFHRTAGFPWCIIKAAISLDGKIAAEDGSSQWITCEEARLDVHAWRAKSQAILIGANTALIDNPSLTVRHPHYQPCKPPLRVVCDTYGKLLPEGKLWDKAAPLCIYTTDKCPRHTIKNWQEAGANVIEVPIFEGKVDLEAVLKDLAGKGVIQLFVEGGAIIQNDLMARGFASELLLYTGNCFFGETGKSFFRGKVQTIEQAPRFEFVDVAQFSNSVRMRLQKK